MGSKICGNCSGFSGRNPFTVDVGDLKTSSSAFSKTRFLLPRISAVRERIAMCLCANGAPDLANFIAVKLRLGLEAIQGQYPRISAVPFAAPLRKARFHGYAPGFNPLFAPNFQMLPK